MKKLPNLFSIFISLLILTGCMSAPKTAEPQANNNPSNPTEAPAASNPTEAPAATEASAAQPAAAQHTAVPGNPPISGGEKWGDHSTVSIVNIARALGGDRFTLGKFERPYNANTMDVYFKQLDIDHMVIYPEDSTWVYAVISMVGRDANNAFTGQYGIELDLDRDGYGDILLIVDNPSSSDWTTQGVHVYEDANNDVGGVKPVLADSAGASGNGYETVLFDQGSGDDPDLAWARLDTSDPNSIDIAYKQSMLGGVTKYTAAIWAGTHLDPALFDYNDHFTHEQAGAADPEITNFYPIKGLSELDNTCREAIGYPPTGLEPGICTVQQP